jgi:nucleotide-binding universal stress UspA family protein/RimJ/RimL family protein N-acetyltransferase
LLYFRLPVRAAATPTLEIRPVTPDDRAVIRQAFERLGPESRYRRFFGPMPALSDRDLNYLTRVDHHDHEALVAIEPETGDGVGVARYVRTSPDAAEPAIAVVDDWQGRGVGTRLMDALVERALAEGIQRFDAPVLAANHEAIAVLERIGPTSKRSSGREIELRIDLPTGPEPTRRWSGLLKQFALEAAEPVRSVLETLWPARRPGSPDDERRNVIVVGTDGSDHAAAAVEVAAQLAKLDDASVAVVGVHRFLPTERADAEATVREAAVAFRRNGIHVREHVRRGDPTLELVDVAVEQRARLIVVGAGERGKTARRLVGSVADAVAERAPCNVLIVRPREQTPG